MTEQFLSFSEAESYTGKSRSSLRRFVEAITKSKDHPDSTLSTEAFGKHDFCVMRHALDSHQAAAPATIW